MKNLLDSNTCIEHLRNGSRSPVFAKMDSVPKEDICLCSIVIAELLFGANLSRNPTQSVRQVTGFVSTYPSLPFDDFCTDKYAALRTHLTRQGKVIGAIDMLIAAIALANNLTLVTHNTYEFARVPGLLAEDWQGP